MNAPSSPFSLKAYDLMLDAIELLAELLESIEKRDRDLGNQLRRAASSVALNLAEAQGVSGGNRLMRRRTALGSLYEAKACLDVAIRFRYVDRKAAEGAGVKLHAVGGLIYALTR